MEIEDGVMDNAGYLDVVLLPALAVFIGLTLYALWHEKRRKKQYDACGENTSPPSRNFPHE